MALVERREGDPIGRDEAAAALAARAELGPEYDDARAASPSLVWPGSSSRGPASSA